MSHCSGCGGVVKVVVGCVDLVVLSSSRVSARVVVKSGSCELLLLAVCFDRGERSRGS